jgi:opacity protein-like surface antigen
MKMKKILLVSLVSAIFSPIVHAADLKPYVEGSIGYANVSDSNLENLLDGTHSTHGGEIITSGSIRSEQKATAAYGVEIGLKDLFIPNLRLALSETYMRPKSSLKGTFLTNAGTTVDVNEAAQTQSVNIVMVNAYYDFKIDSPFTPYVGAGLGAYNSNANHQTEFAWSLMAGGKYHINDNVYVGAKATYYRLSGASIPDSGTLSLSDTNAYTLNANLGYEF